MQYGQSTIIHSNRDNDDDNNHVDDEDNNNSYGIQWCVWCEHACAYDGEGVGGGGGRWIDKREGECCLGSPPPPPPFPPPPPTSHFLFFSSSSSFFYADWHGGAAPSALSGDNWNMGAGVGGWEELSNASNVEAAARCWSERFPTQRFPGTVWYSVPDTAFNLGVVCNLAALQTKQKLFIIYLVIWTMCTSHICASFVRVCDNLISKLLTQYEGRGGGGGGGGGIRNCLHFTFINHQNWSTQ